MAFLLKKYFDNTFYTFGDLKRRFLNNIIYNIIYNKQSYDKYKIY